MAADRPDSRCAAITAMVHRQVQDLSSASWRMLFEHLRYCPSCRVQCEALCEAAVLEPADPPTLLERADDLLAHGKLRDAEVLYRQVIAARGAQRGKDLAAVFYNLGTIREQLGDRHAAVECYDEAYRLDATHALTLAALGRIAIFGEDWEKARRIYRAILLGNLEEAAGLNKAGVYYHLGLVHAKLGETAKALNMYERGLELDPQSGRLRKAIESIKRS